MRDNKSPVPVQNRQMMGRFVEAGGSELARPIELIGLYLVAECIANGPSNKKWPTIMIHGLMFQKT